MDNDPVRAKRELIAKWTLIANRVGYMFMALAVSAFVMAFALGFKGPLVTAPGTTDDVQEAVSPGWFHDTSRIVPTVLWSLLLVAVWIAGRRLAGTGWRRVAVTVVSGAVFLVVLFMVFENLTGLLPANL